MLRNSGIILVFEYRNNKIQEANAHSDQHYPLWGASFSVRGEVEPNAAGQAQGPRIPSLCPLPLPMPYIASHPKPNQTGSTMLDRRGRGKGRCGEVQGPRACPVGGFIATRNFCRGGNVYFR